MDDGNHRQRAAFRATRRFSRLSGSFSFRRHGGNELNQRLNRNYFFPACAGASSTTFCPGSRASYFFPFAALIARIGGGGNHRNGEEKSERQNSGDDAFHISGYLIPSGRSGHPETLERFLCGALRHTQGERILLEKTFYYVGPRIFL